MWVDATIEERMPMNAAKMFWQNALHNYHLDRSLLLPYDRYRALDEPRSGRSTSISFDFGQDMSHHFLLYASSNNLGLEHLALACYYSFLFKLCNGERDLCIGMFTHGRYEEELMSMIGLFGNIIPLRCQLDPHWSLYQLLEYVQEMMDKSVEHSYYPLQRIFGQYSNVCKPAFLKTSFTCISANQIVDNEVMIGDSRLKFVPISVGVNDDEGTNMFDFALTIHYDLKTSQLWFTMDASLDLFDQQTVDTIARRFNLMMSRLFDLGQINTRTPIYELSLTAPDEGLLIQSMNNTQVLFPPLSCVHHDFVYQMIRHPQKLAVELDDQSLTYAELVHYAQVLALELLNNNRINPKEIVCQCVERSLSMVSCSTIHSILLIHNHPSLDNRYDGHRNDWRCLLSSITTRSYTSSTYTSKANSNSDYSRPFNDSNKVYRRHCHT